MNARAKLLLGTLLEILPFVLAVLLVRCFPVISTSCLIVVTIASIAGTFLLFSAVRDLEGWKKWVSYVPAIAAGCWSFILIIDAGDRLFFAANPHPGIWY